MKTKFNKCLQAGLILATAGTVLSQSVTFTKITTGPVATDQGSFGGAAWGDFENRGLLDLIVCDYAGGANGFYRNNGDGTFTRVTEGDLVQNASYQVAPAVCDFDNDGHLDILVSGGIEAPAPQPNTLYRNNGDGSFTAVDGGGVTDPTGYFNTCSVADYDNDGFVDLFIPGEGESTASLLFHNSGDGAFRRILSGRLVTDIMENSSVCWADYDNDGFMDVLVNTSSGNFLYHNSRDGTFTRVLTNEIAKDTWSDGAWGASWGDYDNDGLLDLFVPGMNAGNRLYHNNGDGVFSKVTSGPMLAPPPGGGSRACAWGDYDNDGYLDLFVTSANAANRLFHNNGDGTFTEIPGGPPVDETNPGVFCQCSGWADYDNDGFLDLFVTRGADAPISNLLYHNNGNTNAWLEVKLIGTASNRSAIGARVRVHATISGKPLWQVREINSSGGRSTQPLVAHFGLGDATNLDTLRIEWPSGTAQEFYNVSPKKILTYTEPPRLLAIVANGVPQISLKGGRFLQYELDGSTDLTTWSPIGTMTVTNLSGTVQIVETNAPVVTHRFYRAMSH